MLYNYIEYCCGDDSCILCFWGKIEPDNLKKHTIIEIEIFGHFGCRLLFVSQMTSLLTKNMKNL